jgi:SAM-dependent MidA family methyltransferase
MGSPEIFRLVELGPGRGTLMRDALRAAQVVTGFHAAASVHLVEVSPVLIGRQRQTLTGLGGAIEWHRSFDEVPEGPLIAIANEFFDVLPVHQAIKLENGWHERVIEINRAGNLSFATANAAIPQFDRMLPARLRNAPVGACYEWRANRVAFELGRRIAHEGGAALVIDYGHAQSGLGETLQAVGAHTYADPLALPGEIDLTAHVDFRALADAVESMGARAHGPIVQGEFLHRLGIEARAERLKSGAAPETAHAIEAALARLTGTGQAEMGELFKVIAFADFALKSLPGFEP